MLSVIMSVVVVILSFVMLQLLTPYWMVGVLILQTLSVGVMLRLTVSSIWFCYILFLVFLGGMLVIFSYVSSLVSEELLESIPYLTVSTGSVMVGGVSILIYILDSGSLFTGAMVLRVKELSVPVVKLFASGSVFMYSFVVVYLLLALFCVANMSKSKLGPLRLLR